MTRLDKLRRKILAGTSDRNIRFAEVVKLLRRLGFDERIKGSHHIFTRNGLPEILNLQPKTGGLAKPYQVRQVRQILVKYGLGETDDD